VYSEKIPDDGQKNCPKHAEFYSNNKFEKFMYLVGFIIRTLARFTYITSLYPHSHHHIHADGGSSKTLESLNTA